MRPRLPVLVLAVLVATACARSAATERAGGFRPVDEPMPVLAGEDLHGRPVSTSDLAGEVLVVNTWASWCLPYCADEQPDLVAVANRYADRGVRFLGVNHMDQRAAATEWERHYDVPYPSLYDPSGRFAATLDYFGLPNTYVVDAAGTIRYALGPGPVDDATLSATIDAVLADQASASSATATNSPAR